MATNGGLVGFDAVRPHTRLFSARDGGFGWNGSRGPHQKGGFEGRLREGPRAGRAKLMTLRNVPPFWTTPRPTEVASGTQALYGSATARDRRNAAYGPLHPGAGRDELRQDRDDWRGRALNGDRGRV
jgi:hypothetical protein